MRTRRIRRRVGGHLALRMIHGRARRRFPARGDSVPSAAAAAAAARVGPKGRTRMHTRTGDLHTDSYARIRARACPQRDAHVDIKRTGCIKRKKERKK